MAGLLPQIIANAQGLQGLAAGRQQMEQQKAVFGQQQEQLAKTNEAGDYLRKFYASQQSGQPDYNALNEAILRDSRLADNVLKGVGMQQAQQYEQAAADVSELLALKDNPEMFKQRLAKRANDILARGGDPADTIALAAQYEQSPLDAIANLNSVGAALTAKGYKLGVAQQGYEPMTAYQAASTNLRAQELEIKKLEQREKAIDREMQRETNELRKAELQSKLDDAKAKSVAAKQEKEAGLESARSNLDNMLNSLARVSSTPTDVIENATGPVSTRLPTLRQDTADFEELVTTLGSQAFLSQIPLIKGMGQLSNAEGEKLQAALQNFSLRQSPQQLKANLKEAERLLMKARANIAKQYGAAETKPDVPAKQQNVVDWGSL